MADKSKETENSLYDISNVPKTENSAPARIDKAGIAHNLKPKCEMVSGDYKNEEAKARSVDGKWHAFQLTLTDPDGLEFVELYFQPPQNADEVKFPPKHYELADGKLVEARECTPAEGLKVLNNEFLAYLIDIGEAMGYKNTEVTGHLYKNLKGFQHLGQAFIDRFKPNEKTRVSAKILWYNNKKQEKSFLKLHGAYPVYYPYGNDLLDVCMEGRPTVLKLTNYETTNGLRKLFTGESDAPTREQGAVFTPGAGSGQMPLVNANEEDPF